MLYYYCWGRNLKGKKVCLGLYDYEAQAYEEGYRAYSGIFEVVGLPTKNLARAKSMLKARDLKKEGVTIDEALRYTSSKLP